MDGPVGDTKPSTDLILRTTLEELIGWRGRAIAMAHEARDMHIQTLAKIKEAQKLSLLATPSNTAFYQLGDYVKDRHDDQERFTSSVQHDIDRAMWGHLLTITGIEGLMDKQARDEFDRQLQTEPPEVNVDNVRATFQQFKADAHTIFRRGLVNAFSNLDRTYRSHDGFKIGTRVVNSYGLTDYGSIYGSADTLRDVDRIMHVLDGCKVEAGWYSPMVNRLQSAIRHSYSQGVEPGNITTEYWHIKWFKNRNIHLYPQRKDLVRRANRLIAEHFDEAIGEGPDAAGARRYHRAKPHHSQVEDFYPSPPEVVARMLQLAQLQRGQDVLEPSAGDGAIAMAIVDLGIIPDCVEIDPDRSETLRDMLPPGAVVNMDFLKMHAEPEYDRIIMNPPWGSLSGVAHVFHAVKFLKPGGRLVGVLGAGTEYRVDGPTRELRDLIAAWGGTVEKLPHGSFKASGTMVNAVMFSMTKPGATLAAPERGGLLEHIA